MRLACGTKAARYNTERMAEQIGDLKKRKGIMDAEKQREKEDGATASILAKMGTRHVIQSKIEEAEEERERRGRIRSRGRGDTPRRHVAHHVNRAREIAADSKDRVPDGRLPQATPLATTQGKYPGARNAIDMRSTGSQHQTTILTEDRKKQNVIGDSNATHVDRRDAHEIQARKLSSTAGTTKTTIG